MRFIKKQGILFFLIVLFAHCVFIYLGMDIARIVSKLLLLPILALYLLASATKSGNPVSRLVYFGLLFSFLGDLLLTQSGETFFLLGMLAFIGTHVCNGIYFLKLQSISIRNGKASSLAAIILFLITLVVFSVLNPYLENFQLPILVYMVIISCMAILAANTESAPSLKKIALQCFIPGAALFVLSDAILAMNKFLFHQPMLDIAVMLSYGGAQYFLVSGFVQRPSNK